MANPSMDSSRGAPQQVHRLEKNVLSVPNGIALAAAAMAPVIAVVLNAPAAGPVAGAALPLSFLLAFIACLLVGNSIVQFARHLPSAGSFYTPQCASGGRRRAGSGRHILCLHHVRVDSWLWAHAPGEFSSVLERS